MTKNLSIKSLRKAASGMTLALLAACTTAVSAAPIVMYRDVSPVSIQ